MRRGQAADFIDDVRELAAKEASGTAVRLSVLLERYGLTPLEPCGGEAHSNAFIDNCPRCSPRWGFVGAKEPVT